MHAPLNAVIRFGKKAGRAADPGEAGRAADRRSARSRSGAIRRSATIAGGCSSSCAKQPRTRSAERKAGGRGQRTGAAAVAGADRRGLFGPPRNRPSRPRNCRPSSKQTMGLGRNSWPLSDHPTDGRLASSRLPTARKKSPAYEVRWLNLGGFCLRPGFGFPGDDFRIEQARRVYACGLHLRQPGPERNRLVDFLGTRRGRTQSQPADRHLPAALPFAAAAGQEAAARQSQPAARDVAHRGQPGTAARRHQNRSRRSPGEAREGRRCGRERISGASRASARASFSTVRSTWWFRPATAVALGRGAARRERRRRGSRVIAQHTGDSARDLPPATLNLVRACTAVISPNCSPSSKATHSAISGQWAAFSARNSQPASCLPKADPAMHD